MKRKISRVLCAVVLVFLTLAPTALFAGGSAEKKKAQETKPQETVQQKPVVKKPVIRLSTTTSVNDSGLLPYLQPFFEKETGYKLEITSAGTGAAIEKGRTGDADCLLVHAKASEDKFVEEGFGVKRIPFMHNYFIIIGPKADPAGIKGAKAASEAFKKIAESGSTFISRGDDSGTHKAELKIWKNANVNFEGQKWYLATGQGMGASIVVASEKQAYIMTDKATYLSHKLKDSLDILMEETDELKNTYSLIAISPAKWADVNIDGSNAFIQWMTSPEGLRMIAEYGVSMYGQPLFFVK